MSQVIADVVPGNHAPAITSPATTSTRELSPASAIRQVAMATTAGN